MRLKIAIALSLALNAMTAQAATYGLVIGIDKYTGDAPQLEGAVNDARDVADALTKNGAREVKLLLDSGANRNAIMAAWNELLKKAVKNDLVVFHYAGHGGQEPEHVKGSEPSGYDSTLLLAGFKISGTGTFERIVDDELGALFKRASDAGVNVLVAMDACHSGTMTRAFSAPSKTKPRVRATTYPPIPISDDKLPPFDPAWSKIPDDLPNVIYFGAVQDDEEAPEISIDGKSRGALSWALAAGLRGGADANHDGVISKEELQSFIQENIRMKLEGRQHPSVVPAGFRSFHFPLQPASSGPLPFTIINSGKLTPEDLASSLHDISLVQPIGATLTWDVGQRRVTADAGNVIADFALDTTRGVLRADGRADLPAVQATIDTWRKAGPTPLPGPVAPLTLAILNSAAVPAAELVKALNGVRPVDANSNPAPMLTWDVGRGQVFTGLGDLVAELSVRKSGGDTRAFKRDLNGSSALPPADGRSDLPKLQVVIDKWHLTEQIKQLAQARSLHMALQPDDKRHTEGAKLTFLVDGHDQTYLTVFNLGADGTINFLYPLNNAEVKDPLQIPIGRTYTVPLVVEPPFGADHLVAIVSDQSLDRLHRTLQLFDGKTQAAALEPALLKELESMKSYRIGIHGSYTGATR
ncbi:MAG: caspase family protein [Rhodospirillaceae bacterium]